MMSETYLDRRRHFRTPCDFPLRCRTADQRYRFNGTLVDISERGMAFISAANRTFKKGDILRIALPVLRVTRSLKFRVSWIREDRTAGKPVRVVGVAVDGDSAQPFADLVDKMRQILCWREIEQHLRKRRISSAEALREWRRRES